MNKLELIEDLKPHNGLSKTDAAIFAMSIFNVIGLYMLMGSFRADLRDYQSRIASGEIKRYK